MIPGLEICPITSHPLTSAISLHPCGHIVNEYAAKKNLSEKELVGFSEGQPVWRKRTDKDRYCPIKGCSSLTTNYKMSLSIHNLFLDKEYQQIRAAIDVKTWDRSLRLPNKSGAVT